mgnify:CR=1 FL=1
MPHFNISSSKKIRNLVKFLPSKMPTFEVKLLTDLSMFVGMLCPLIISSIISYNICIWSIYSLSHQNQFNTPYQHLYIGFTKFSLRSWLVCRNHRGYEQGEIIKERESGEYKQEIDILSDKRSQIETRYDKNMVYYYWEYKSLFTTVTIFHREDDTLSLLEYRYNQFGFWSWELKTFPNELALLFVWSLHVWITYP